MCVKFKKIILAASVMAALTQTALAGNQFFYIGAEPVYVQTNFNWTNDDVNGESNPQANGVAVIDDTNADTQLGLFIGYGLLIDKIYLGVEGATQVGTRTATSTTQDYNTQMTLNNKATMSDIYIVDFRPGYVLGGKNSMIYGILGLNTANFEINQETGSGVIVQDSSTSRRNGLRLGLGYNLGLGKYLMARLEYVYTQFSDFEFTDYYPDMSQLHTWQLSPYSNELSLGISLIFNI